MIRPAVSSDRDRVLMMAKAFHAASGFPFPFSAPMADVLFQLALIEPDRLCLVCDVDGRAAGVLGAQAYPHQFSPIKVAQEMMWWIDPVHRQLLPAVEMLRAYEAWARERGCALIHMVGLGADPVTTRLYQHCGFEAAERHFMKPLSA